jgi:hypothetical protein
MGASEEAVRSAFAGQAEWCRRLGSPFTGLLCDVLGTRLDRGSAIGRRILDWPGDPAATGDALPLRVAGGLHALVGRGVVPNLAALYPPAAQPLPEALWAALAPTLSDAEAALMPWLDQPPQTNEVARSAVLMAGLLATVARTGPKLALYELGASAGLNLVLDRYAYRLGTRACGDGASSLTLAPVWEGGDPPAAALEVVVRGGVDMNPLDVTNPADCERLLAYVWPDQAERIARLRAALAIARADPPALDRGDAAEWVERQIRAEASAGVTRVVMHSIAFGYFPVETRERISRHLGGVGAAATDETPLAWLRYELEPGDESPTLRLRLWPGGADTLLARADAHGRTVSWHA